MPMERLEASYIINTYTVSLNGKAKTKLNGGNNKTPKLIAEVGGWVRLCICGGRASSCVYRWRYCSLSFIGSELLKIAISYSILPGVTKD